MRSSTSPTHGGSYRPGQKLNGPPAVAAPAPHFIHTPVLARPGRAVNEQLPHQSVVAAVALRLPLATPAARHRRQTAESKSLSDLLASFVSAQLTKSSVWPVPNLGRCALRRRKELSVFAILNEPSVSIRFCIQNASQFGLSQITDVRFHIDPSHDFRQSKEYFTLGTRYGFAHDDTTSFHDKEAGPNAVTALISLYGFGQRQRGGQYRGARSQEDCLARIENPLDKNRSGDRVRRQSVHGLKIRQTPL